MVAIIALNGTQAIWPFSPAEKKAAELFSDKWIEEMDKIGDNIDLEVFKTEIERALEQRRQFNVDGTKLKFQKDASQVVYGVLHEQRLSNPDIDVDSMIQ